VTNKNDNIYLPVNYYDVKSAVITVCKYACNRLKKLQETYKDGNVVPCLQFIINILMDGCSGIYVKNWFLENIFSSEDKINSLSYDKMKIFWNVDKLTSVCNLYKSCYDSTLDKKQKDNEGYLNSIFSILNNMDEEFWDIIKECHL